jgi:hypothetical protein
MKAEEIRKKLMVAARANAPRDHVPPAFEKRVMALILARPAFDLWAVWARGLWYAAGPCVAIMLLFSGWAFFHPISKSPIGLAQQLDNTLLAAVDQDNNDSNW